MAEAEVRAVCTFESAKLIGRLTRIVGNLGLAEAIAQDALGAALATWPASGIPANPGAWLLATAQAKRPELDVGADDPLGDDVLRLVFLAGHPMLPPEARVALMLHLVGGLTIDEVARAFDEPAAAIAERIATATRALADAGAAFEVPRGGELADRLACVLEVIYMIFNEGYAAPAGDDPVRASLCEGALRLGLIVAELMPKQPETHGLVALMALHLSRADARRGPDGEPIQLLEQDRARWDREMIERGLAALGRAEETGPRGPYVIQAAISACHARAATPADTEWPRIAMLWGKLAELFPSPAIELNRAVAVAMAYGPAKGLEIMDALMAEPSLAGFVLLASARADLLAKLGQFDQARAEFERAAGLARSDGERAMLLASAAAAANAPPTSS